MSDILLSIVAGLVLFLFAISQLSDSLKAAVGLRANDWIAKFTSTTLSSILVGTIMTVLLDSSSAVIIITIVLVNAKILKFRQAMGIVLGANIGTTFSSQVIAMDVGKFSPILLLIGFVFMFVTKTRSDNSIGKVIFLFGILFFGLYTIELAVEPLKEEPFMLEWLKKTDDPLFGSMAGALATLVIQSSSATVGMAIVLSKKGLLSLAGGVAIMLWR
ncbi:MAG: Na/Pi cotransporter family protein [Flavobacteriales bacterium]|nr:Na/Pi cotransporter family protein [Flavobacteriales bacterium]